MRRTRARAAYLCRSGRCARRRRAQTGIKAAYDRINAAFLRDNMDGLMAYFTPDYTELSRARRDGESGRGAASVPGSPLQITSMSSHWTLQDLQPTAEGVSVQMTMHSSGTGIKRILFAKLRGTFTDDLQVRDLWVHTAQGWRLKHRVVLSDQTQTHPG